jgi:phosphatidate cytidylyltransferase
MISEDLKTRILAALVLIALILPALLFGGVIGVAILVALVVGTGLKELCRVLPELNQSPLRSITILMGLLITMAFYSLPPEKLTMILALFPLLIMLIHLPLFLRIKNTHLSSAQMMMACLYVAVPLSHAILMRKLDSGVSWIFFMLVVVALGDAAAYLIGKRYGKRKFAPNISDKKTYEGFAGVFIGGLIGMVVVKTCADALGGPLPSYNILFPLTIILGFTGALGDLLASSLKRKIRIKDFGELIPGHGGALDRADSHILSFPVAFYFLTIFNP